MRARLNPITGWSPTRVLVGWRVCVWLPVLLGGAAQAVADDGARAAQSNWVESLVAIFASLENTFATALTWLSTHYTFAPALVLGLLVFVVFPVVAGAGAFVSRTRHNQIGQPEAYAAPTRPPNVAASRNAILELKDPRGTRSMMRYPLTHPFVQIGRSQDVDILLNHPTVHRLHAAIHRNEESQYCVTDLCAGTGNGVAVNGQPVLQKTIQHGDEIQIGAARLTFIAS